MATTTLAPAADDLPQFFTVRQLSDRFQLSKSFLYEQLASGRLRSVKIGAARRIPADAAYEFARSLTGGEYDVTGK